MRWIDVLKLFLCGGAVAYCAIANAQDPTGFTEQLNVARARHNLVSVAFDQSSVVVAKSNNGWQRVRGLGHHVTGGLAQCAAIGCGDTAGVLSMWLQSPPHAAIILSPALTAVGYQNDGYCATVACSMKTNSAQVDLTAPTRVRPGGASYCPSRRGLFRKNVVGLSGISPHVTGTAPMESTGPWVVIQGAEIGTTLLERSDVAAVVCTVDMNGALIAPVDVWTLPSPTASPALGGFMRMV